MHGNLRSKDVSLARVSVRSGDLAGFANGTRYVVVHVPLTNWPDCGCAEGGWGLQVTEYVAAGALLFAANPAALISAENVRQDFGSTQCFPTLPLERLRAAEICGVLLVKGSEQQKYVDF